MKKALYLLIVVVASVIALLFCNGNAKNNPIEIAKKFQEKDFYIEITVDKEDFENLADKIDASNKGIECIVAIEPNDYGIEKGAAIFFCKDTKTAKAIEKDIEDYADKMTKYDAIYFKRALVKRSGRLVFFGCEDIWEDIK